MRANEMQSFDTHKFIKKIQSAGFKEKEAEAIVDVLMESRDFDLSKLATKDQIQNVEERLGSKIINSEERIYARINAMEGSILRWMVGTIVAVAGLFAAYLKIFGH